MILSRFALIAAATTLALAAACSAEPPASTPTPRPTPVVLRVDLALDLAPIRPDLSACAAETPNTGVLVFEALSPALPENGESVTLVLGDAAGWEGTTLLLGQEQILVTGSQAGPLEDLATGALVELYSGERTVLPGTELPPEIWVPLEGSAARLVLDEWMGERGYTAEGFLAPDPIAVIAAARDTPAVIGVIPAAWQTAEVRTLLELAELPVLALTDGRPTGSLRAFLGCLQERSVYSEIAP